MLVGHIHAYYASPTYGRTNLVPILEYLLAPLESIPILSIGLTQNIRNSSIALSVRVLPRFPPLFHQFFDSLSGFLSSSFEMLRNLLLLMQSGLILTVFYSISWAVTSIFRAYSSNALSVRVLPRLLQSFDQIFDYLSGILSPFFEILHNPSLITRSGSVLTGFYSIFRVGPSIFRAFYV